MDYYEELGLSRTASLPEIRQAYKVMARLVHPDGQASEVREMAERQMKRLNEILATLSNEQSRREYDAGLMALGAPPPRVAGANPPMVRAQHWWQSSTADWKSRLPAWAQRGMENWYWISLAAVLAAVGIWYVAQGAQPLPGASAVAPPADLPPAPLDMPRPARPAPRVEIPAGAPAANPLPESPAGGQAVNTTPPMQPASMHTAPVVRSAAHAEIPMAPAVAPVPVSRAEPPAGSAERVNAEGAAGQTKPRAPGFAGNWLLVPDSEQKRAPGEYLATYVELLISEENSRISGRYRAQYQIPDRAVSPEVVFQIQGEAPAGASASYHWTSVDGAKGEVEMELTGANLMKLTWWTTEFGRHAALASGTARLIRQQVR